MYSLCMLTEYSRCMSHVASCLSRDVLSKPLSLLKRGFLSKPLFVALTCYVYSSLFVAFTCCLSHVASCLSHFGDEGDESSPRRGHCSLKTVEYLLYVLMKSNGCMFVGARVSASLFFIEGERKTCMRLGKQFKCYEHTRNEKHPS